MVDSVKNYGIAGVSGNVELGKGGPRVVDGTSDIQLRENGGDLTRAKVLDGTADDHAVTKDQLEGYHTTRMFSNVINFNDSVTNQLVVRANTTILSVAIRPLTGWTNGTAATTIKVGDSSDNAKLLSDWDHTANEIKEEYNVKYTDQTTIKSTVTTGSATTGTARLIIMYAGGLHRAAPQVEIDSQTEINIFFDTSGSMNSSLDALRTAKNELLKEALLPFYKNDSDDYDNNVSFVEDPNERTFGPTQLQTLGSEANVTQVINLVFQDEASPYGAEAGSEPSRTNVFDTDMAGLRSAISSSTSANGDGYYKSVVFRVASYDNYFSAYQTLINNVHSGTSNYSGTNGLSDFSSKCKRVDNVTPASTAAYYTNTIIDALNTFGFAIPNISES
jgi:hypothetical protein